MYQTPRILDKGEIRAPAVLTGSYVYAEIPNSDNPHEQTHDYNQLILHIDFTIGSLGSCEIVVQARMDESDTWRTLAVSENDYTNGNIKIKPAEYFMEVSMNTAVLVPISYKHLRVGAIGNGTVTGSSLAINAQLANV